MSGPGGLLRGLEGGLEGRIAQRDLPLPGVIDGQRQDPLRLLRRMKPGRVLRFDEVEQELRSPVQAPRELELGTGPPGGARRLYLLDQRDDRVHRAVSQVEDALLVLVGATGELLLRPTVTGLACAAHVEERTSNVVIADLEGTHPF